MNNNNNRFLLLRNAYLDKIITPKKDYDTFLDFVKAYYHPEEITEEESVYNATYKNGMFLTLQETAKKSGIEIDTVEEINQKLQFDYFVLLSYDFRSTVTFLPIKPGNRKTYLIFERKTGFFDTNSDYLAMELRIIKGIDKNILTANDFTEEEMRYLNALDYLYQEGLLIHSQAVLAENERLIQALKDKLPHED
ncbi:MAG: hypothetical protein IKE59_03375 [Erysipelotrichaceae bacterium]|nr:hypothetical protein [Erysipelotrichaceae bacterium]